MNRHPSPYSELLRTLQTRFEAHMQRHPRQRWARVLEHITANPEALAALAAMEDSGGEPDVVSLDAPADALHFCDCAPESPVGRRSLCFDDEALNARKENRPAGSAQAVAASMGTQLLDEAQYRALQRLGEFDLKTSSWLATPPEMRALGGALFGDRRFGRVFVYHNGAQSYYAARGFRALLSVPGGR